MKPHQTELNRTEDDAYGAYGAHSRAPYGRGCRDSRSATALMMPDGDARLMTSFLWLSPPHWGRRPCPHLLILDEPTNFLDKESLSAFAHALQAFGGGALPVVVPHGGHHSINQFTGEIGALFSSLKVIWKRCWFSTETDIRILTISQKFIIFEYPSLINYPHLVAIFDCPRYFILLSKPRRRTSI